MLEWLTRQNSCLVSMGDARQVKSDYEEKAVKRNAARAEAMAKEREEANVREAEDEDELLEDDDDDEPPG